MQKSSRPNPFLNRKPLSGTSRETFISRVRKELGHSADRSPDPGTPPFLDPALIRQVASDADRAACVDRFQKKMTENKATVHRVPNDPAAILAAIDAALASHTVKSVLLNLQQLAERLPVAAHLQAKNVGTFEWGAPNAFADSYHAEVSITDAPAGLADTGALLVWSHVGYGRSSTLVTPIHITLLPTSRILPDLVDGLDFVRQQNPNGIPSNVVVINGPSKTGDIEMKLVTGVHGPKYMYVILIDGL